jgi:hypothetical protein
MSSNASKSQQEKKRKRNTQQDAGCSSSKRSRTTKNADSSDLNGDGVVDPEAKDRTLHGATQLALYAGARRFSSPAISHSLNVLIEGEFYPCAQLPALNTSSGKIMWLWYFDQGRILRTTGMDTFDDFPFFVMFLAILQRMDRHVFGQHTAFIHSPESKAADGVVSNRGKCKGQQSKRISESKRQLRGDGEWRFSVMDPEGHAQEFGFEPSKVLKLLRLIAGGTRVFDTKHVGGREDSFCGIPHSDPDNVYHIEESRPSEVDALEHAYTAAQKDSPSEVPPPG